MSGPIITALKSFFRQVVIGGRTIVTLRGGQDFALADGARLHLEGAAGDTYLTRNAGTAAIDVFVGGGNRLQIDTNRLVSAMNVRPDGDGTQSLGQPAARWGSGLFQTELGIHSGAAFTDSILNNGLILGGFPALTSTPTQIQIGVPGGAGKFLNIPFMTTVEAAAVGGINGDMYYDTTLGQAMIFEAGAFRNF